MDSTTYSFSDAEQRTLAKYLVDIEKHPEYKRLMVMKKIYGDVTEEEEMDLKEKLLPGAQMWGAPLFKPMKPRPIPEDVNHSFSVKMGVQANPRCSAISIGDAHT